MKQLNGIIVNADDFGITEHDNRCIVDGLRAGTLTSTTLMVNMPAFEEACVLTLSEGLRGRVGLHFNLTYGKPLSPEIRKCRRFCDAEGQFRRQLSPLALRLTRDEKNAVALELNTQWQRCKANGVTPSHIDSHQHIHNIWPVGMQVAAWAQQNGVPVRIARNIGARMHPAKRVLKSLFNARLAALGVAGSDWACKPSDLLGIAPLPMHGLIEIIAHPVRTSDGTYSDETLHGEDLESVIARSFANRARLSYGELAKIGH